MVKTLFDRVKNSVKDLKKYQPGKGLEDIKDEYELDSVIKMSSNENPWGHSREIKNTIHKSKKRFYKYPDSDCSCLKKALANFYNLSRDKIFIGNGSDEIIDLIMSLFVEEGEEVIYADPTFIKYRLAVKSRGGKSIKIPLTEDYVHDLDRMAAAVTEKTKVIFICDPNNPTGTITIKRQIEEFIDKVPSDVLVVIDQAYYEYVTNPNYFDGLKSFNRYHNLILLRTFSKIYGLAGLRVGYGLGNSKIIDLLNRIRSPFNVNTLAQEAAEAALSDQKHVQKCKKKNKEGKIFLYQSLEDLLLEYIPTQGNFILINTGIKADVIFHKLLSRGIIIRPGNIFGLSNWIRVTIGREDENKKLISALKDVLLTRGEENDCCNENT